MTEQHLIATIMDESWLTMEQLAHICKVETAWLQHRLDEGLFPHAESVAGTWRFSINACCVHNECTITNVTSMRYLNWLHW